MTCFNPKDRAHFTSKGGRFACAGHGSQHFMALKELFSSFPTGAKNDVTEMEHWDVSEKFGQLSPRPAKTYFQTVFFISHFQKRGNNEVPMARPEGAPSSPAAPPRDWKQEPLSDDGDTGDEHKPLLANHRPR